ncbi:aminopeptidase [Halanaerobacter jeridensis]|uniref:Leucyl aminopeptidase (Aminopeptidase T) n=1 Tax=Halanaerobacter jeridensis TaxID=706427 RepID=A0A939BQB6_9FIRM|nr:aminopeptidase [Halanaerobacter jeridensis]MBM7556119.1 leucyl aminopeptidase (aminopeptidase T) [Halanaerobacter jeridensis]
MSELAKAAQIVVKDCLAVEAEEEVLVVVDQLRQEIGEAIYQAGENIGAEVMLIKMLERENHGAEPPTTIAEAMKDADVVIMPTTKSLSHTAARVEACKSGTRAVTLPGITAEMMKRTLNADYQRIKERSESLAEKLSRAKKAKITAPNGTDLELVLEERKGHPDTGIYHQPGDFGNLPAGEAYIAPLEGKANGKFVVDGSMSGAEVHTDEIELIVADGYVTDIKGGTAAEKLKEIIAPYGQDARNIAELGIGTNDQAQLIGNILEDEKVMSTVHVAIGDNSTMGGEIEVASHLDGIIENPTVKLDNEVIMKDGKIIKE